MPQSNILENVSLKKYSTFAIGGNADYFLEVHTKDDLQKGISFAKQEGIPFFIGGGGSNVLFSDKGLRGIFLYMKNEEIFSKKNGVFQVEAGAKLGKIFGSVKKENRDFALFSTIPGTLGGAVAGNAGIPSLETKDFFSSATLYNTEKEEFLTVKEDFFNFKYRKTSFHYPEIKHRYIIWDVTIHLPFLREEECEAKLQEFFSTRKSKQPWGKTGGSFFSNPGEGAAGYFLEQVGMKGYSFGDAFFSEKHANFLMNKKNATQEEVKQLARKAREKVLKQYRVVLTPEVKILDESGEQEIL